MNAESDHELEGHGVVHESSLPKESRENLEGDDEPAGEGDGDGHSIKKKKRKKKKKKKAVGQEEGEGPNKEANGFAYDLGEVQIPDEIDTLAMGLDSVTGRCMVANRDFAAGDYILCEPPFAKVVDESKALLYCATCCKKLPQLAHPNAEWIYAAYCSKECEEKESGLRQAERAALRATHGISTAASVDVDVHRMVVRLIVTRAMALELKREREHAKEGEEKVPLLVQQWQNMSLLMHHRDIKDKAWLSVVTAAVEAAMPLLPEWCRCDVDEAVELACRSSVNSYGLVDASSETSTIIGHGMFPLFAMFNHSCRPNCTFVFEGGVLEARTLIEVKEGTELNFSYIDLVQSTPDRRTDLLTSRGFLCHCPRCR
ncbi:unnamed protein product [Choristocarpus tenellus]